MEPLKQLAGLRLVPAEVSALVQAVNLDDHFEQEAVEIDVPLGDRVLYSLVKITGFMAVINGAPGASGPVLNLQHVLWGEPEIRRPAPLRRAEELAPV